MKKVLIKERPVEEGIFSHVIGLLTLLTTLQKQETNYKLRISEDVLRYIRWSDFFEPINEYEGREDHVLIDTSTIFNYFDKGYLKKEFINDLNLSFKKYFITKFTFEHIEIPDNTIGIHFRGNEGTVHKRHLKPEEYFEYIDNAEKIFLATDDTEAKKIFTERYKEKIIFNNFFTSNGGGVHKEKELCRFTIAVQAFNDAICLSKCNKIFGKSSNLTTFSKILNPTTSIFYLDSYPIYVL